MSLKDRTDEQLMSSLRSGQKPALEELVRRYQTDLFRFCLHFLRDVERSKELAQETFIRVYTARDRFDSSRKFKPWVMRIAKNLCLNEIKRKKAVPMESLEEYASSARSESGEIFPTSADGPDEQLMEKERLVVLTRALDGLPDDAREIVTLRFFQRMSAKEIADIVGSSEGAVRTRLHRILKSLRSTYSGAREDL